MSSINDQQRAVGVLQDRTATWSDEFIQTLTVVGADNHQLQRPSVVSQVLQKAAVYHHRFHPQIRMASLPTGQPTIQVGECPTIAFDIRRPVVQGRGSPAHDRVDGSVAQPGLIDGGAQQYTVVGRPVYLDDDPIRRPVEVVVAGANDRHRATRRYGQSAVEPTRPGRK
jgi:hypothetical protein